MVLNDVIEEKNDVIGLDKVYLCRLSTIYLQNVYKTPSKICKIYKNMQKFLPVQYQISTSKEVLKVLYLCGKIAKTLYLSAFFNTRLERRLRRFKTLRKPHNQAVF